MDETPEFSRKVDVSRLSPEGIVERIEASPEECEALAARFDAAQVHSLTAELTLRPWKRGSCRVRGIANIKLTRTCVVSLEPFESTLQASLDRLFAQARQVQVDGKEIVIEPEEDDFGEIENGYVEVGEFAVEELLLELDPHPRKPGAEFEPPAAEEGPSGKDISSESPFAVLKSLKNSD